MGGGCSRPPSAQGAATRQTSTAPLVLESAELHSPSPDPSLLAGRPWEDPGPCASSFRLYSEGEEGGTPGEALGKYRYATLTESPTSLSAGVTEKPPPPSSLTPVRALVAAPQSPYHPPKSPSAHPRQAQQRPTLSTRSESPLQMMKKERAASTAVYLVAPPLGPISRFKAQEPVQPAQRPGSGTSRRTPRISGSNSLSGTTLTRPPDRIHNGFAAMYPPRQHNDLSASSMSSTGQARLVSSTLEGDPTAMRLTSVRSSSPMHSQGMDRSGSMRRVNSQVSFTCSEDGEVNLNMSAYGTSPSQTSIMVHDSGLAWRATPVNPSLRTSTTAFNNRGFRKSQVDEDEVSITRVKALMRHRRAGETKQDNVSLGSIPDLPNLRSSVEDTLGVKSSDVLDRRLSSHRPSRRSPVVRCIDAPESNTSHVEKI